VGKLLGYRVRKEELMGLGVGQIKQEVQKLGGDPLRCVDKGELVELLVQLSMSKQQQQQECKRHGCHYQYQKQQQEYTLKKVDQQQQPDQGRREQAQCQGKAAPAPKAASHGLDGLSAHELKKMLLTEGGRCIGPMEKADLMQLILANRDMRKSQQPQPPQPQHPESAARAQAKQQQGAKTQSQQQQQQPRAPARPEVKTCCCCHAMHNVTAPGPDGSIQLVQRYIGGIEGGHMMQRLDGLWVCEWCSTQLCQDCWELSNNLQERKKGLWSQEVQHLQKCTKHQSGKKGRISRAVLKKEAEAWDRAHCQGCRDKLLLDRMLDLQKVAGQQQQQQQQRRGANKAREAAEWAILALRLGATVVGIQC
jgi:hypothetical protein